MAALAASPVAAGWRDVPRSEPLPAAAPVVIDVIPEPDAGAPVAPEPVAGEPVAELPVAELPVAPEPVAEAPVAEAPVAVQPVAAESPADPSAVADPAGPCGEEAADCRAALAKMRSDSLDHIDLDIRVRGRPGRDYPCECRLEGETFAPRRFATTTFTWKAAGYCHKPLYFEHWNLERYGHSHGFVADSFLSAVHFFARVPALPYQMGVELPWECIYPLGYYRPGSCAPWTVPAVPVSARGLALEAATATGIVFILP